MKLLPARRYLLVSVAVVVVLIAIGAVAAPRIMKSRGGSNAATPSSAGTPSGDQVVLASTETPSKDARAADPNGNGKKTPVPVNVAAISRGAVSSYITSTANLVPENEVKVLAEAEGRLADLRVEEGDRVARGQVLASLAKDDAEIALRKAQLRAANAKMVRERAAQVVRENMMSREEFERITLADEVAQQEQAEAEWRLEKTSIRAPFAGCVTERFVKPGQHVRPGDVLFTVSDFDPLIAWIYLPEGDVLGLEEGREVRITLKASEDVRFEGRVRQISPVVDTSTGTVKVTVEAIAPPAAVRPGAFVTVGIVRESRPRVVLVPREAVVRELQDAYVFVAKGEVAEKRSVALGIEEGRFIEAVSGVTEGEQVIVAGQGGLKDGSVIKVLPAAQASNLATRRERPARG